MELCSVSFGTLKRHFTQDRIICGTQYESLCTGAGVTYERAQAGKESM
jgi:hypothetical protein